MQSFPRDAFEVLVIDNGSTDETAAVVESLVGTLRLTYIMAPEPGLHVGRHAGMREARADVLMFADDDIEAEPSWVEAVVTSFADPGVALVGGNNRPCFEDTPPPWLLALWRQPVYKGHALPSLSVLDFGTGVFEIDPGYVWGCNFCIRRDALLKAGGFHPDGVPWEQVRFRGDGETHVTDLIRRCGMKTVFNSGASVRHRVTRQRMTKDYFEQRAFAQGVSDSYTDIRRARSLAIPRILSTRRNLVRFRAAFGRLLRSLAARGNPAHGELLAIQRAAALAYRRGYAFHRTEVGGDPALLDWVLKEDYLS